jgi:hypothetical protein
MCGGPTKIHVPLSTRLQAETGVRRYNERFEDGYRDLETKAIDDSNVDRSGAIASRAGADLAGMDRSTKKIGANGPSASAINDRSNTIATGASRINSSAKSHNLQMQDAKKLATVQTGLGQMKNADLALQTVSSNAVNTEFTNAQSKIITANGRMDGAMAVMEGIVGGSIYNSNGSGETMTQQPKANVQATDLNQSKYGGGTMDMPTRNSGDGFDISKYRDFA